MEHEIPFGNSNRENRHTFLDFPLFWEFSCGTNRRNVFHLPAEPEIPEILTKWKAPTVTDWGTEMLFSTIYIMFTIYWIK